MGSGSQDDGKRREVRWMSVPLIGPGPIIRCHPHILVAGQEQWSGSSFGHQMALVGLGVSISKTLTPLLALLKSHWEVPVHVTGRAACSCSEKVTTPALS